jgi:hypothetical protein
MFNSAKISIKTTLMYSSFIQMNLMTSRSLEKYKNVSEFDEIFVVEFFELKGLK